MSEEDISEPSIFFSLILVNSSFFEVLQKFLKTSTFPACLFPKTKSNHVTIWLAFKSSNKIFSIKSNDEIFKKFLSNLIFSIKSNFFFKSSYSYEKV